MKKIENIKVNNGISIAVEFSIDIYSLDVIKTAAYRFTDRCSFMFENIENKINVIINFTNQTNQEEQSEIIDMFKNEVLDQDLRKKIAEETEEVRNLILANAFSNTKLINP